MTQPLRIYKLGPWPDKPPPVECTPLGARVIAMLSGGPPDHDADTSRILLRECLAHERYRLAVTQHLSAIRQQVESALLEVEATEPQPGGSVGEHWAHGYSCGERRALERTAQLIQDVINGAAVAVGDAGAEAGAP